MLLSITVICGFKREIRSKVSGFEAQLTILPTRESGMTSGDDESSMSMTPIRLDETMRRIVGEVIREGEITAVASRPMILKSDESFRGVVVKSYDEAGGYEFVNRHLVEGEGVREDSVNNIVISRSNARRLSAGVGDRMMAYFFMEDGSVKQRRLKISGVYDTHFGEYDDLYVFASPGLSQSVDGFGVGEGNRLEITGLDDKDVDAFSNALQDRLTEAYYLGEIATFCRVDNVHRRGSMYFNWLDLLDMNVIVILVLMSLVASVTLISSMFILVLERVNMIGVLKALGATNRQVRNIFILLCERIMIAGLLIGNIVALGLIWLQSATEIIPLDAATYYLSSVPVYITWWQVVILNVSAIALAGLVLIVPSHIIATISPSESIRFD